MKGKVLALILFVLGVGIAGAVFFFRSNEGEHSLASLSRKYHLSPLGEKTRSVDTASSFPEFEDEFDEQELVRARALKGLKSLRAEASLKSEANDKDESDDKEAVFGDTLYAKSRDAHGRASLSWQRLPDPTLIQAESFPSDKRLELFRRALEEASPESLEIIRSEFLEGIPGYREMVHPVLLGHALAVMLSRFSESDWQNWPNSSSSVVGGPSYAKAFVNDVYLRNHELGSLLETAAFIFHRLALVTEAGQVFNLREELREILQREGAASISVRSIPKIPLSANVAQEETFHQVIERLRVKLTIQRVTSNPVEFETALRLISVLSAQHLTEADSEKISTMLRSLCVKTSVRFRETKITSDVLEGFERLAGKFANIARALAEFYAIRATDALLAEDIEASRRFFSHSEMLSPGLKSQSVVARYLNAPERNFESALPPEEDAARAAVGAQEDVVKAKSSRKDPLGLFGGGPSVKDEARKNLGGEVYDEEGGGGITITILMFVVVIVVLVIIGFGFKLISDRRNSLYRSLMTDKSAQLAEDAAIDNEGPEPLSAHAAMSSFEELSSGDQDWPEQLEKKMKDRKFY